MNKKACTFGVFDLLHYGHLNIINKSKKIAKKLIVYVEKDSDVFDNKNKFPILTLKERIKTLRMLSNIDEVKEYSGTIRDLNTIKKYLDKEKPDVLIQGNDLKLSNEVKKYLKDNKISLVLVPYSKKISTTIIRRRMYGNS